MSREGKGLRAGREAWQEFCPNVVVLYAKDLEVELQQDETLDQTSILKPWIRLLEAPDQPLRGDF